jgi:glycerophosphoryl diester phosphodiesterase
VSVGVGGPLILAHRGASHRAPDNTVEAFELAIAEGADAVETDVRATRDGVLVLHHDATLPDGRTVAGCPFGELRAAVPRLVRLEELCAVVAGRCALDVELKTAGQEERVLATLDASLPGWQGASVITSFLADVVVDVKRRRRGARVGLLVEGPRGWDPIARLRAAGGDFLAVEDALVDDALLAAASRAHVPLVVWTVDRGERAAALAAVGVDGIITNRPAAIRGAIGATVAAPRRSV